MRDAGCGGKNQIPRCARTDKIGFSASRIPRPPLTISSACAGQLPPSGNREPPESSRAMSYHDRSRVVRSAIPMSWKRSGCRPIGTNGKRFAQCCRRCSFPESSSYCSSSHSSCALPCWNFPFLRSRPFHRCSVSAFDPRVEDVEFRAHAPCRWGVVRDW